MPGRLEAFRNLEKPTFRWHLRSWEDINAVSWFTKSNYVNVLLIVAFVAIAIMQIRQQAKAAEKAGLERRALKAPSFPPVTEDAGFDYTKTEPLQLRPFKPTYHLTMGRFYPHSALLSADDSPSDSIEPPALETLDPEDLILMDKNYPSRIKYRKDIMEKHHDNVVNATKDNRIDAAVKEFYIFIMGTYLPSRYPSMFKLHKSEYDSGMTYMLENQVTGQIFPASPLGPATKTVTLLETLAFSIDEEFLFLLPEEESDVEKASIPKYVLHAYTCICASGFNPSEKIGKRLVDIHEPVPSYVDKLDRSMDRFFDKIEVGKYVKRVNWSITTDGDLYAAGDGTNHARKDEEVQELKELDLDQTFVRCERQTLHRLPKSKALVFAFKTYLYPLRQIKEEGLGPELADAIDGLKEGNAPGMHFYKRGAVWGEAAKKYLRS